MNTNNSINVCHWRDPTTISLVLIYIIVNIFARILKLESGNSISFDAVTYHIPELSHFISQSIGFESAPGYSGPIPGYHWFNAAISRAFGLTNIDDALPLIMISHLIVGIITVFVTARLILNTAKARLVGYALSLFIVLNFYLIQATYYFNTELPSYMFLAAVCGILVRSESDCLSKDGYALGAACLGLVLCRHSTSPAMIGVLIYLLGNRRWQDLSGFLVFLMLAILILLSYADHWGGLVSPFWQKQNVTSGLFPHSLLHVVALSGIFSPIFVVALWDSIKREKFTLLYKVCCLLFFVVITVLWLIADTNISAADGRRFSIVWRLAAVGPNAELQSMIVLVLALLSTPLFSLILCKMVVEQRLMPEVVVLGCYLGAQIFQNLAYQRYVEVPLLIGLVIFTARYAENNIRTLVVLFGFSLGYGVVSLVKFFGY